MSNSIERADTPETHLPGEVGVWMFIAGDVVIFTLFFAVFMHDRSANVALFAESQTALNQVYGAANTLLLLSSSWLVALGVHAARDAMAAFSARLFGLAFLCGAGFVGVKVLEWGEKLRAGLTLETNDFFMYYYLLTGIHLLHLLIGMGVLVFLWHLVRDGSLDERGIAVLESGASFWHLVDVLWIALFALLYLVR